MLSQEENELVTRVGPGTPMGNLFREYWLPALLQRGAARARQRSVARHDARRTADRFPRHATARSACWPEQLPASRRVAVLRPQRGRRPALRLPRLEVRHRRQLRRHAQRARRVGLQVEGQGGGVPDAGARRHRLGVSRLALDAAAAAGPRSQHAAGRTGVGVPAVRELVPDPRGPHRHRARELPALRRPPARGRADREPSRSTSSGSARRTSR